MNEIEKILSEIRPEIDFSNSGDFIENQVLDSLDIIRLVSRLDSTYRISIDGSDIIPENFKDLETIAALVKKHLNNQ